MRYVICPPYDLRAICVRYNWFTRGTSWQYDKLFELNSGVGSLDDIALAIWLCSDDDWSIPDIKDRLRNAKNGYLIAVSGEKGE